ncbi:SDR family NAD(P)-dependent oxidoreductase, partial [Nocardia wallacei]|uniref:SDR family NAD(P)-dependent oxidoreductase n=1 Tax=Nocardia wallacei TaxID=480035 RepID=UPI0024576F9E
MRPHTKPRPPPPNTRGAGGQTTAKGRPAAVHHTAATLGRLDILVNNAGIFPAKPFEDFTLDEIDQALH